MRSTTTSADVELNEMRIWRRFVLQNFGKLLPLENFRFATKLSDADALAAYGLGDSEWAPASLAAIREEFEEPVRRDA